MRTLSQVIRTESSGDKNQPIEIYDLLLDTQTLHFAQYTSNISFYDINGNATTYTALPIEREGAKSSFDLSINNITIKATNINNSMSTYLANNDFRGRRLIIRKLFLGISLTSGDAVRIFDGIMDTPSADENWVSINAVDRIGSLQKECPKRWYQLLCNWKFGSTECGINLSNALNSGDSTINSATTVVITDSSLPNSTSGDNYWKNGYIQITSGVLNNTQRRIQSNTSNTITLDTAFPSIPAVNDSYTIWRNCDQTRLQCSGDFNNDINFGGFPTIPESMVIR